MQIGGRRRLEVCRACEKRGLSCRLAEHEPEHADKDDHADAHEKNRCSAAPPWVGVVIGRVERIDVAFARVWRLVHA